MTEELLANGISLFIAGVFLIVSLYMWRLSLGAWAREELFSIRHDLFMRAGSEDRGFDAVQYREQEAFINGLLRWIDRMDGLYLASLILRLRYQESFQGLSLRSKQLKRPISEVEIKVGKIIFYYITFGSISGLLFTAGIIMFGLWHGVCDIVAEYSKKMSRDDEFAIHEAKLWKREPMVT